ncbi:MAG: DUF438 domain-containing protein [Chloroflexi bacterium]|nr:DUF438 domain-containing protein [Chloroflexota bacterium]
MEAVKEIDARGLDHAGKEALIFPRIEALQPGESLKIVLEFNPVPLVYMLKARDGFEVKCDSEGPDRWVLNVKRTVPEDELRGQFKSMLKDLKDGQSQEAKERARELLQSVDATTLGIMEQELIREGVSHEEIRKSLCDIHLEVMKDSLVSKRTEVAAPHPVHTLMEEHKVILSTLNELDGLVKRLRGAGSFEEMGEDREKLKDVSHHLIEAESHHQREEDVLFPRLEKHDVVEPPQIMKQDHVELRKRKQALYQAAHNPQTPDFPEFKKTVIESGEYLASELASHIFKEDNILYQIALQVLSPEEWEEVKKACDRIGYCCFTPQDVEGEKVEKTEAKIEVLDLRTIMPFERHDLIFEKWDALKPGDTLKIINDHDPKPLHYQFEAEYKGQYEWEYIQKGPRDWVVEIKRV